jgi:hypothetical protein
MSIYASTFGFGCDRKPRCARLKKVGRKTYEQDDSNPCTCGSSPIEYQGSHILPSNKDRRGGVLSLGAIPGHIARPGRKAISHDMQPYWPWLRVSIWETNDDPTILLTRQQVEQLRDELTLWLKLSVK